MKKTLAAVAILGAFAGSALADVSIYGKMDMGLKYTDSTDVDPAWALESGTGGASRIGLKGEEKISDDLTVGFKLEKTIKADNGDAKSGFDRASYMYADTGYGKFIFGHMSSIMSDAAEGMHAEVADVFGTGTKGITMAGDVSPARVNNSMMYKSPVFSGFQVGVQYASEGIGQENTSKDNRYYGAVAQYKVGDLALSLGADVVNRASVANPNVEDQYNVGLGGTYDFGFMKASVGANYFKHADFTVNGLFGEPDNKFDDADGYGIALGSKIPAFGGEIGVGLNYTSAEENAAEAREYKYYNVGTYYSYNLSKSTLVYVAAAANKYELDKAAKDVESYEARAGLQINF